MVDILSLPPEIALRIVDLICPDDFPSFILVNKAVHTLCEARINDHQTILQKYSSVKLGESSHWDGDGADITHWYPLLFLKEIFVNPHLAFYPIELHIAGWDFDTDHESQTNYVATASLSCAPDLLALLAENHWLQDEVRLETWRDALPKPSKYIYHIALLLTLLPNLETLTMVGLSDHDNDPIREITWAIARANQERGSKLYRKALTKLRQIRIDPEDKQDIQSAEDYTLFTPFAALPSMRSLLGSRIQGFANEESYGDQGMNSKIKHFGSQVLPRSKLEEIIFTHSNMEDTCWESLLMWTSHLKTFVYHDLGWTFGERDIDFNDLIGLLTPYVGHSLETLHLIVDPDTIDFSDQEDDSEESESEESSAGESGSEDFAERVPDIEGLPEELAKRFEGFDKLRDLKLDGLAFKIGPLM